MDGRYFFIDGQCQEHNVWYSEVEHAVYRKNEQAVTRFRRWFAMRRVASSRLRERIHSWGYGVTSSYRYNYSDTGSILNAIKYGKTRGKSMAALVAQYRKAYEDAKKRHANDEAGYRLECARITDSLYAKVVELQDDNASCVTFPLERLIPHWICELQTEASLKLHRYDGGWVKPAFTQSHWYNTAITARHYVHVSEDDPTQIAYSPSTTHLVQDRWVRTRVGRYLTKYFSKVLSESDIRDEANRFSMENAPVELGFVPNTDPDTWVQVYENGTGFSSCMVLKHPNNRYVDRSISVENHPVRAYACDHHDNFLALAYMGSVSAVAARAIVNKLTKTYVRVYGDDRMVKALEDAGYRRDGARTLSGQVIHARPLGNYYIAPYLDWGGVNWLNGEEDCGYFVIDPDGVETSADGIVSVDGKRHECQYCGDTHYEDDMTYVDCEDGFVCERCLDRHFVYAFMRRYEEYCRAEDCVNVNDTWYHMDFLDNHGIVCAHDGEYYHTDDCVYLEYLNEYVPEFDVASLDRDHGDDSYALGGDVVETEDGETIHEDDAEDCVLSGNTYFRGDMWKVTTPNRGTGFVHPDNLNDAADDVYVFADNGVTVLLLSKPEFGGMTLREFVTCHKSPKYFSNVEVLDDADSVFGALLSVDETEEPMLLAA